MPHARVRAAAATGRAGRGREYGPGRAKAEAVAVALRGMARRGRRAASGRVWPVFCHLIHIITGVSPFDGEDELIASVTVPSASPSPRILRCLSPFLSQPYIRSPPSVQISVPQPLSRETTSQQPSGFPVLYLCAHGVVGEQVPPEPSPA